MAERNLTLSVVVISWNQCAALKRLVAQLLDQDFTVGAYEIIIVDDGSRMVHARGSQELREPHIRVILGSVDRGRAASRNSGIKAARHEVVVMVDGDHSISRDFLSRHAERHQRERCAIVGLSQFADRDEFRALNTYLNEGGAAKLPPESILPGRYFLTRNCSVPRDILESIGCFDARFASWGGEDLDLGVTLQEAAVPIYGEPRALALHHHWRPLKSLMKNMTCYGRDAVPILLEKHPQLFAELNLDHVFSWQGKSRYSAFHRRLVRGLLCLPIYLSVRTLASLLKRHRLPRLLFDYLHFRAYTTGFMTNIQSRKDKSFAR